MSAEIGEYWLGTEVCGTAVSTVYHATNAAGQPVLLELFNPALLGGKAGRKRLRGEV